MSRGDARGLLSLVSQKQSQEWVPKGPRIGLFARSR